MGNEEVRIKEDEGCRATLTLSTDDGEQAGEENDRMAPHHLFSPSFPPRGYFHPAVLQLVFTFLVSCRTRRFAFFTQPKKTLLLRSFRFFLFLSFSLFRSTWSSRDVRSSFACRSLDGISYEPLATESSFNVTKDPAFSTHITLLPRPVFARDWISLRAKSNRGSSRIPFHRKEKYLAWITSPVHSLMNSFADVDDPLPRSFCKTRRGLFEFPLNQWFVKTAVVCSRMRFIAKWSWSRASFSLG